MQITQWMENKLAQQVVEAALEVHSVLGGPGLLETVYEAALSHELTLRGLNNLRQLPIPVKYKNIEVRRPLFLDILVKNEMILEIKATDTDYPFYYAQLMTHLKLTETKLGLLINFGKKDLRDGFHFMVNDR